MYHRILTILLPKLKDYIGISDVVFIHMETAHASRLNKYKLRKNNCNETWLVITIYKNSISKADNFY